MSVDDAVMTFIERTCSRRRWLLVGFLGFIPGSALGAGLGAAVAGRVGGLIGFLIGGISLLVTGLVCSVQLENARCPRCDDYFYTGLLKASNPELETFGMLGLLLRRTCVNCGLRVDCP